MKKIDSYVNECGVTVTVYASAKPRKTERTWIPNSKYSIYQMGHMAAATGKRGVRATVDKV